VSATLSVNNYGDLNRLELTSLDADTAIGATTALLQNVQNITANSYLVIGAPGEGAEMVQVASVAGNVATFLSALKQAHSRFEVVRRLFGNQHKIYRAANVNGAQPADGSFALVSGGTIDIDPDQAQTLFTDSNGSSDYWYKAVFYNSTSTLSTDLSQAQAARGNGYGIYCSVESIRQAAGFENNRNISDALIDEMRQAAQSYIDGRLSARYTVPFNPVTRHISHLTRQLAAGYLLVDQYGSFTSSDTNNGQAKIDSVIAMLDGIAEGTQGLPGAEGVTAPTGTGGGGFSGWPNDTTYDATTGTGGHMFSVHDVSGMGRY
jgi:phage gp36-like protein